MKDNGKVIKEVVEVCKFGKMALFIKDIGKIILHMVMEDLSILMVMFILGNGRTIEQMGKVFIKLCR
jgi:hypothetical protein